MIEIWKDIEGYEGLCQVSNLGRVRSLDRDVLVYSKQLGDYYNKPLKGRILRPRKGKTNKYNSVLLSIDGHHLSKSIHRLVANAFIPNPDNLPQINHKDENKDNNRSDNLEWCTQRYNSIYNDRAKNIGKKLEKAVSRMDDGGNVTETFASLQEAADSVSVSRQAIFYAIQHRKKSRGYYWKYKEP